MNTTCKRFRSGGLVLAAILCALAALLLAPTAALALQPGTSVYGTVVDATTQQPIAGALIRATGGDLWDTETIAITDALGNYESQLPDGVYSLVCIASDRYQERWVNDLSLTAATPRRVDFQPAAYRKAFYGWVKDAGTGSPLSGATLMLETDSGSTSYFARDVQSDAGGYYEIYAPAGSYDMRVTLPRHASQLATDVVFGGAEAGRFDFQMSSLPTAVSGKVTDSATGLPLADATVVLTGTDAGVTFEDRTTTGQDGDYRFYRSGPATYSVCAYASGYRSGNATEVSFEGSVAAVCDFALEPVFATSLTLSIAPEALEATDSTTTLTVSLVDEDDGPLAGQTVALETWNGDEGEWFVVANLTTGETGAAAFTLAPGSTAQYRAVYSGSGDYLGSTSRSRTVSVPLPTYLSIHASATTLARYNDAVTLVATIRASDAEGADMAGVPVELQIASSAGWKTIKAMSSSSTGTVTWSGVPRYAGNYRFRYAGVPGSSEATVSEPVKVVPRASLSAITAYRYGARYYRLSGYLWPQHVVGSSSVRIMRWKYENRTWKRYTDVYAKVSDASSTSSRYSFGHRFPSSGTWKLQAVHSDIDHAASYSAPKQFIVK